MRPLALAGIAGLLMTLAIPAALAGETASEWLERMSAAMGQMTYQGTFVYIQGDDVQTMHITHLADENGTRERLVSVSGPHREVVRDAKGVRLFSGDKRGGLADPAINRPIFFELPISDAASASDSYEFRLLGGQRIAGHSSRRLDISPRDGYRYGHSLWLDQQSGLLLQWKLLGPGGEDLARLMFTELKIGSEVDPEALRGSGDSADRRSRPSALPAEGLAGSRQPEWAPASLPPGFHLASHRSPGDTGSDRFEHLVYSDGIAAVSVYIEERSHNPDRPAGLKRMGTAHAYFRALDDLFVTVVGDVPEATVKLIGEAVRPVQP
ncbi:MucB/RseB C-terminal domain-containing protein [Elongatibacter sediminis]|uniref:MucB/RseB C-terminal domain-containing protein n=1 Tax=Elongatibacter sediminis TaxID=3119006 RepID=A0AAW9RBG2_9GAMM